MYSDILRDYPLPSPSTKCLIKKYNLARARGTPLCCSPTTRHRSSVGTGGEVESGGAPAGDKLESAFLADAILSLKKISNQLRLLVEELERWLLQDKIQMRH